MPLGNSPAPPQGAPAPGPQGGAPAPQAAQPPQGGGGGGGAEKFVSMVGQGIEGLKGLMGQADPQLKQSFMGLMNAFHVFVQDASQPPGGGGGAPAPQGPPKPTQPMPANAAPGSKPANF